MTRAASPKLAAYAGLAGFGLLGALLLGRLEAAILAVPFLLVLVGGLALAARPDLSVRLHVDRDRILEGDDFDLEVAAESAAGIEKLQLQLRLPPGLELAEGAPAATWRLAPGVPGTFHIRVRSTRWGAHMLGGGRARAGGGMGLFAHELEMEGARPIRVYPRPEPLRRTLRALETQALAGDQVARLRGEGIEFADIRPFTSGDRRRSVNWRVSARTGNLHVNQQHPERNRDVVLFLDSFRELRRAGRSSLDPALRAATSLALRHLRRRDRVGLVSFGGIPRWLSPAMGVRQAYRIAESLIETEVVLRYAWLDIALVPPRMLPPAALVIALTPLLDERSVDALLDLRGRGYDVAVLEISPLDFVSPRVDEDGRLAHRLWRLKREALKHRYQSLGVPVVTWSDEEPLDAVMEELRGFRRSARRRHA